MRCANLPEFGHGFHRRYRCVIDIADMKFVKFAPDMRPARDQSDGLIATGLDQACIGSLSNNLGDAGDVARAPRNTARTGLSSTDRLLAHKKSRTQKRPVVTCFKDGNLAFFKGIIVFEAGNFPNAISKKIACREAHH